MREKQQSRARKILRTITGIILAPVALATMIFVPSAHVTMCMISATCYSAGLLRVMRSFASFFAGWILFYTIFTGSTLLFLEWGSYGTFASASASLTNGVWLYHFLINFAVLVLFIGRTVSTKWLVTGLWLSLLSAPLMLFIGVITGRGQWEGPEIIASYFILGLIIMPVYLKYKGVLKNEDGRFCRSFRKSITWALLLYALAHIVILLLAPFRGVAPGGPSPYGSPSG